MAREKTDEINVPYSFWDEYVHTTIQILNNPHLWPNSDKTPYKRGMENEHQSSTLDFLAASVT